MKNSIIKRIVLGGIALSFVMGAQTVSAQNNATASAEAHAKIVSGIALTKNRDMNFGSIVRSASGGTVTLDASSGNISFSGVTQGQARNHQTAMFTATGESDYLYTITLPRTATLSTPGNGNSATMTVTDFTHSAAGELDGDGSEEFNVGATLQVGANQRTGVYSGSFDVTVQYQ